MHKLLTVMQQQGGSDLFISADFPPSMKYQGAMKPLSSQRLTGEVTRALALSLMNERSAPSSRPRWSAISRSRCRNVCRFRVNVFVQQQSVAW
jgi:twitching motility protein PilU